MRFPFLLLPLLGVALAARAARADEVEPEPPPPVIEIRPALPPAAVESEPPPRVEVRPAPILAVEPSVGLGTPLGYLGASLVLHPARVVALHAGVGLGQQGPQIEAGLRHRISIAKDVYVSPGVSWSTGSYATVANDSRNMSTRSHMFYWDRAHFLNATLAVEPTGRGISARPFVGLGYALGKEISTNRECPESGCRAGFADRWLLFAGFAMGFDLF